ncbi:MAG: TetR/AcrR family transcriptional regulator [Clostridia bacterium]|nr:TetR/AcrR family transcriptional regulator [Clostridia bacterium]
MKLSAVAMAERRKIMLQAAFCLFCKKDINTVTMSEVAAETGYTLRSLHRYFRTKDNLVAEVATWTFGSFIEKLRRDRSITASTTAVEDYIYFVDAFLILYREHYDLLRFNQFFNIYVRTKNVDAKSMESYQKMIIALRENFHASYEKHDGTLSMDFQEEEIFSTTLHLMLAAVTRYAVGLVYQGGNDQEQELITLRNMLIQRYTV